MAHDKAYTFVAALFRRSKNRTATNLDHYAWDDFLSLGMIPFRV